MQTEQLKSKALEMLERARNDSTFMEEIRRNPEAAMVAAGLPAAGAEDLVRELDPSEVSGYIIHECTSTCWLTCWITSF